LGLKKNFEKKNFFLKKEPQFFRIEDLERNKKDPRDHSLHELHLAEKFRKYSRETFIELHRLNQARKDYGYEDLFCSFQ